MVPGAVGAIVGLIGTVISRFTDIWEKKEESGIQLELAKRNKELAEIELKKEQIRAQSQADVANSQAMARADEANAKAEAAIMAASYSHDTKIAEDDKTAMGAFIRAVIRPVLTIIYSLMFLYVIWFALTPENIVRQADVVFAAFIEVSVGITLWWFGLRKGTK